MSAASGLLLGLVRKAPSTDPALRTQNVFGFLAPGVPNTTVLLHHAAYSAAWALFFLRKMKSDGFGARVALQ